MPRRNRFSILAIAAAAMAAMALAGCGGGGGNTADPMSPSTAPATHPVERIAAAADSLLLSDIVVSADDLDLRIRTDCGGNTCTMNILGERETLSLSDFAVDSDGEWLAATETRRGVSLVGESAIGDMGSSLGSLTGYGGWLEHNFFIVVHATISDDEIGNVSMPLAVSIGDATGTNPASVSGSATWSGVMLGTDVSATASRAHRIRGDADIAIADLTDPSIGVAFTGIQDLDSGGPRGDMTWSGIPLAGGSFAAGSDGNSIEGRFHGPNHEEVGGIFERDRIVGAFGAKRQ